MSFVRIRSWGEFSSKLYDVFFPRTSSPVYPTLIPTSGYDDDDQGYDDGDIDTDLTFDSLPGSGFWNDGRSLNLDLNQLTRRVNRSFFKSSDGLPVFSSLYIIHLILALGLIVALLWLVCAFLYYTMQKLRSWCPSFKIRRRKRDVESHSGYIQNEFKEMPTPEILEQRRQDRLHLLQKECEHLGEQLIAEKNTGLTSRASDSDLEYLGFGEETPPLKRNSISLQDIPQSVIKIRREKQLRQLKEEIEHLHALSQSQDLDKEPPLPLKSPLLTDLKFEFPSSKSSSPSPVELVGGEPLSQRISHLKAQRKLNEIRADLEGLALHLVHSDDIKVKTSSLRSLQDLPKSALDAKRHQQLVTITKEIEHMKNYKIPQKSCLEKVLPVTDRKQRRQDKRDFLEKINRESSFTREPSTKNQSPSKNPLLSRQESEMSEGSQTASGSQSHSASMKLKQTRQQELNRVRVELKELSYKLNLNYVFDDNDRERMVPPDWPKQCSFSKEDFE